MSKVAALIVNQLGGGGGGGLIAPMPAWVQ